MAIDELVRKVAAQVWRRWRRDSFAELVQDGWVAALGARVPANVRDREAYVATVIRRELERAAGARCGRRFRGHRGAAVVVTSLEGLGFELAAPGAAADDGRVIWGLPVEMSEEEYRARRESVIVNLETGERFASLAEAERRTGVSASLISRCLRGAIRRAGGCRWERSYPHIVDNGCRESGFAHGQG